MISLKKIWWTLLISQLLGYALFVVPVVNRPWNDATLFLVLISISWASSLSLAEAFFFKKEAEKKGIAFYKTLVYLIISFTLIFSFLYYLLFTLPVSIIVFAFMSIIGWLKLFKNSLAEDLDTRRK